MLVSDSHTTGPPRAARVRVLLVVALAACTLSASPAAAIAPPTLGGRIQGYAIVPFEASPRQNPELRIDLHAEQRPLPRLRWHASIIGLWGGPPIDARGPGIINLDWSFQDFSPSLELDEAWIEYRGASFDLRVGKQKFSWGRLDVTQPNDLLNPRRYGDPFLTDENDAKIAVPALAATYHVPGTLADWLPEEMRVALVWEPVAVPWQFPLEDERWFAPALAAPDQVEVQPLPARSGQRPAEVPSQSTTIRVVQQLENSSPPARRFDNGNVGLRVAARSRGVDWAVVLFDGYDTAPSFNVPITLEVQSLTALALLEPAYERFPSLGFDAATSLGDIALRTEAAWRFRRPYPMDVRQLPARLQNEPEDRERLLRGETVVVPAFVRRDALEWGLGADYLTHGVLSVLEVYQIVLLHNDERLLIRDVDTRLSANLSKQWFDERLETELLFLWGIESRYELARAQLTLQLADEVQVQLGALGIWGNESSLVGEFRRNSELFGRVRYTF